MHMRRYGKYALSLVVVAMLLSGTAYFFPDSAIGGVVMQKVNTYRLNQGLVGWWTFDGKDVTDKVYDRSGQGNHGYFEGGATSSAKVAGKVGQGLQFDGTDDYVDVRDPGNGSRLISPVTHAPHGSTQETDAITDLTISS